MGSLIVNHNLVTNENAKELVSLCPFGAISYDGGKLDISSACKMCKLCEKRAMASLRMKKRLKPRLIRSFGKEFVCM